MTQTWVSSYHKAGSQTGIVPTAVAPTFSPPAGSYVGTQTVALASTTLSATIYYTVDGSQPSLSSPSVPSGGTISVAASETVNAFTTAPGFNSSAVSSAAYVISSGGTFAITQASLAPAVVGVPYSQTMAFTGGVGAVDVLMLAGTPNSDLWAVCINNTLQGIPQMNELESYTFQAFDSVGNATPPVTLSLNITVSGPLALTNAATLPPVPVGGESFARLIFSGGAPPYNANITGRTYPANNPAPYISYEGWVYYNVTAVGTVTIPWTVTDAENNSISGTLSQVNDTTLRIQGKDPIQGVLRLPLARVGHAYQYFFQPITAAGGSSSPQSAQTFSIAPGAAAQLPPGLVLSFNSTFSLWQINGTPTLPGQQLPVLKVVDAGNNTATATMWIDVRPQDQVARPAYNTGTGFFIDGKGKLRDPLGFLFTIRGFDRAHFDSGSTPYMAYTNANSCRLFISNIFEDSWTQLAAAINTQIIAFNELAIPGIGSTSNAFITASISGTTLTVTNVNLAQQAGGPGLVQVGGTLNAGTGIPLFANFTGSISGTTLTVTTQPTNSNGNAANLLATGGGLSGGISAGTWITGQLSGTTGGIGTYSVNNSQTVALRNMTQATKVVTQLTGTPGGRGTYQLTSSLTIAFESITVGGVGTSGLSSNTVLADVVMNGWGSIASSLLPFQAGCMINIINEWGTSTVAWQQANQGVAAQNVSNISGNTLTLNSGAATNPLANVCVAYISGGGIAQAVTVSSPGGTTGAWTVQVGPNPITGWTGTATTITGGTVGVMRSYGFTCPLLFDSGNGGEGFNDLVQPYSQNIQLSDPLQNCAFAHHLYICCNTTYGIIANATIIGSTLTLLLNFNSASFNPFTFDQSPGSSYVGYSGFAVSGVQGITGINTTLTASGNNAAQGSANAWTLTTLPAAGISGAYGGGGAVVAFDLVNGAAYYLNWIAQMAASAAQYNLCYILGEFGPGRNVGPAPTLVSSSQVVSAAEAYGIPWIDWAWDDNNLSGAQTNNNWFGLTGAQGSTATNGQYFNPSSLTDQGQAIVLNPRHGIAALATLAPYFLDTAPQVATPTFSPAAGTYTAAQSVAIGSTTPGVTIYYTTNGSTPTTSSLVYSGPISVGVSETLQAIATATGFAQSAVGSATYTINLPAFKFNIGDYILASNFYNVSVANAVTDLTTIIAAGITGFSGYAIGTQWAREEISTVSTSPIYNDSVFWAIFNYQQAVWPGSRIMEYVTGNHYTATALTQAEVTSANLSNPPGFYIPQYILNCGGSVTIPNSYGSSSNTTYPVAPIYPGASAWGLNFTNYNTVNNTFNQVSPQWYNPGVMQAFINWLQFKSQSACPLPTPYNGSTVYSAGLQVTSGGNTYTYINATNASGNAPGNTAFWTQTNQNYVGLTRDQISIYEYQGNNDETSYAYLSGAGQNFPSGTGSNINPPSGVTGNGITVMPSNTAFWAQRTRMYQAWTSFNPHTVCGACDTYAWIVTGQSSDTSANMAANFNSNLPAANRSAPIALDTIIGLALSGPDSYGWDFNASTNFANSAKQGFYGIGSPGAQGSALPAPTVAGNQNKVPYFKEIQGADYGSGFSGTSWTAASIQQIMATAPWATHRIWGMIDSKPPSGTPNAWGGNNTYGTTGIAGAIRANQAANPVNPQLPSSLGGTIPFDYFISPTGSDSNNGKTPATAWAFTSFQNTSANNALMASKRVGIIAGTYSTAGLSSSNPNDFTASLINIPGGTSSASTYIASCNSSGVYAPRVAIISVAGAPTTQNAIMGGPNGQVSGKSSYITIDGITINGNNLAYNSGGTNAVHLIQMYGVYSPSTSSNASEKGIIIENCEIYGILTTTHPGGNAALIFFEGITGYIVRNNYLHDASSTSATDLGHVHAGEEYGCNNGQWIFNTIANCCSGIDAKNSDTGTIVSYNYMFNIGAPVGNTASALAFEGFDGYAAGATTTGPAPINYLLHHNVLDGCCGVSIGDQTFFTLIPINIYNNTVYDTTTGSNLGWHHNTNGASNLLSYYNNIYVATVGTGGGSSSAKLTTGSAAGNALLDYNCYYQGAGIYTNFWSNFSTAESSLANWKTLMGQEAHSFTGNPTFAAAYVAGNGPTQFQLGSGSPCLATGQTGVNVGAWDGTVTQIGAAWCASAGVYPITPNSNNGSGG